MSIESGIRIYVADLAAYNAGFLHGEWIALDECPDVEMVHYRIQCILTSGTKRYAHETLSGRHEEWAIHDYEGPAGLDIGEYQGIESVWATHEAITELYSDDDVEPYVEWATEAQDTSAQRFYEQYQGHWGSLADWAYESAEDCGYLSVPSSEWPFSCIDWERAGSELAMDYSVRDAPGGGIWVFDYNA